MSSGGSHSQGNWSNFMRSEVQEGSRTNRNNKWPIESSWKSRCETTNIMNERLTGEGLLLKNRSMLYLICVGSVMLYGAETWAMTGREDVILRDAGVTLGAGDMMWWFFTALRQFFWCAEMWLNMAEVRWQGWMPNEDVAKRCDLKKRDLKMRQRRLQWFEHVRRETRGCWE